MATASLLPNGKQQFISGNGTPYAGGKVYSYIPTTTTFKTTWQDSGQITPNTNPVTLDASGEAIIYGSGQYRQVLKDSLGNLIWDQLTESYAPLNSPAFTGNPTAPNPPNGDSSQSIATTEFVNATNGCALQLLQTLSPLNAANATFTSIPGNFNQYIIRISRLIPVTNNVVPLMHYSENNGVSIISANYAWSAQKIGSNSALANQGAGSDSAICISGNYGIVNNISGYNGVITLMNLGNNTVQKPCIFDAWFNDGNYQRLCGSGTYTGDTGIINSIQIVFTSGQISSGQLELYGVRNA